MRTTERLSAVDRDALERAIDLVLRSPEQIYRVDFKRRLDEGEEPWADIARHAAHVCQCQSLKLAPWEVAPLDCEPGQRDVPGAEHRRIAVAAALVGKLLTAGLSRYEPDPARALAEPMIGGADAVTTAVAVERQSGNRADVADAPADAGPAQPVSGNAGGEAQRSS